MSKESVIVVDSGVVRVTTRGQRVEVALMAWNANRAIQLALTAEQSAALVAALVTAEAEALDAANAANIAAADRRQAQEASAE